MKKFKIAIIATFASLITLCVPAHLIVGNKSLEEEKRVHTPFPQKFDEEYFQNIAQWFDDSSPFRSQLIKFYNELEYKIESSLSKIYGKNGEFLLTDEYLTYERLAVNPFFDEYTSNMPPRSMNSVLFGRDDYLFYTGDNSIDDYIGSNIYSELQMKNKAKEIQEVHDLAKSKGINFVFMVLPNKEQVYSDKMPTYRIRNRQKRLMGMRDYINSHCNVNFLYPLEDLIHGRTGQKQTYFQQDTHWNSYGGMIVYEKAMSLINKKVANYEINEVEKTGGDLAVFLAVTGETYKTNTVTYRPDITTTKTDGNNSDTASYTSSNKNGEKCIFIGDSFRWSQMDFFAKDFENVFTTHKTNSNEELYANMIDEMMTLKSGDTIVLSTVERYFDSAVTRIGAIKDALKLL